ncbi:hypothetical protein [Ruminococcus sp.]|uniref:hypothetical protein n=1 Tax=Ruminococcus sp. TaxID=41978 RepID=UPI002E809FB5|nr:hypothetical protein [Ruminococcus sp.]MEE3493229.1 hypothetical protein [Ruminococcus sp.]
MEISLQQDNENAVLELIRSGRLPHTIILEGGEKDERDSAALLLAAGAVCREANPPCLRCNPCRKVLDGIHPDVFRPEPSKNLKSGILSLKDLRDSYLSQMSVRPNEADCKVYIFTDADKLLREDSQNALLKTIEEPPQSLYFIFTVQSAKSLLLTVRSRAHIMTLHREDVRDEDTEATADKLIDGVVSLYEYDLLHTLYTLSDKARLEETLCVFTEKLRQALSFYSGVMTDDPSVKKLTRKLDRRRVIALIEITNEAVNRLKTNVNIQLLTTWLSSQYRRITWQK